MKIVLKIPGYGYEGEALKDKLNPLIAEKNNAMKTNYIKAKMIIRQCGGRDIINECSKLAQKEYKTRHD